jgi:hypothetical protein
MTLEYQEQQTQVAAVAALGLVQVGLLERLQAVQAS